MRVTLFCTRLSLAIGEMARALSARGSWPDGALAEIARRLPASWAEIAAAERALADFSRAHAVVDSESAFEPIGERLRDVVSDLGNAYGRALDLLRTARRPTQQADLFIAEGR